MKGTSRARRCWSIMDFVLPSALDNRPLNFPEFMKLTNQLVYVSATPAEFEIQNSIVGNAGYVPHKRARIGEDELVPFVLPGESVAAVHDRRTVGQARRLPSSGSARRRACPTVVAHGRAAGEIRCPYSPGNRS